MLSVIQRQPDGSHRKGRTVSFVLDLDDHLELRRRTFKYERETE